MTSDDAAALKESFDRMADRMDTALNMMATQSQVVNNNSDSKGIWVCVTCCIVMMVAVFMGLSQMNREFNRQDSLNAQFHDADERANTYLSSIFGRVPDLKKAVEADYELRQKMKGQKDAQ